MRTLTALLVTVAITACTSSQGPYAYGERPYSYGYNDGYYGGYAPTGSRWDDRYPGPYTYRDDIYYRECRHQSDSAGVLGGAVIGGLLGNAVSDRRNRTGPTVAGVVLGGLAGAALTSRMNCGDRSYAYRTYHRGLNAGPGRYGWQNPQTRHRGEFYVQDYYRDRYGNRCANYSQTVWIDGRPQEATGYACQQPDGTWTFVT